MKNTNKMSKKQRHTLNRKRFYIPAGIMITALIAAVILLLNFNMGGNTVVAIVDGEPVTLNEMKLGMAKNKAYVFGYFNSKYNAKDSKEFLTTSFDGEIPLEKLKKDALNDCIEMKVKLIMAKRKGLIADISYEKFLKDLEAENMRRKNAIKENQVVYGPKQYDEAEYYRVVTSNITGNLIERFERDSAFSEEDLKKYYQENKEKLFRNQDVIKVMKISVNYLSGNGITKSDAEKLIINISKNIINGMKIEEVPEDDRVKIDELLLDPKGVHSYSMENPDLISKALKLEPGEVTDVIDERGAFSFAKCMDKISEGYVKYEEAKKHMVKNLSKKVYDSAVERQMKEVHVDIITKVYDHIGTKHVK